VQNLIRRRNASLILSLACLSGLAVGAFAIGGLMLPNSAPLGERIGEMTCLQLAFTSARAMEIISSFPPEAQAAMARLLVPGDVTFAWSYGLILAGLVGLLARRLEGFWFRAGAVAMWLPLVASFLDCVEDVLLLQMVTRTIADPDTVFPAALPFLASTAATVKYLALCILTPAYAIGGIVEGLKTDRSLTALIIYLLLFLAIVNIVMRPLQQLPGCL